MNISEVSIAFNGREEIYTVGKKNIKNININENTGLIKICYENISNIKYLSIPIELIDSYIIPYFKIINNVI